MAAANVKRFLLPKLATYSSRFANRTKYVRNIRADSQVQIYLPIIFDKTRDTQTFTGVTRLLAYTAASKLKNSRLAASLFSGRPGVSSLSNFSTGDSRRNLEDVKSDKPLSSGGGGDGSPSRGDDKKPLKLMEYNELLWPHPLKMMRNYVFSFLIRGYFDESFSFESFLNGAEQAVSTVSRSISRGQFEALEGLVSREAIREIREHYVQLSTQQQAFIAINSNDIFFRFIYEIGMIFDSKTDQRFVEITTVFQGLHGLAEIRRTNPDQYSAGIDQMHDQIYVCNYRFIREFTKGKNDDWTINKLNHFCPKELVQNKSLFSR